MPLKMFVLSAPPYVKRALDFISEHWHEHAAVGRPLVIQVLPHSERITDAQRRRYWGVVLAQIAEQARPGGKQFSEECWHEHFKQRFIGIHELPGGRRVGMSSETLGVAGYNQFMEQVEQYAVQELGVEFDFDVPPLVQSAA